MLRKKTKKATDIETRDRVKREMAKPRMAKSARIAEMNLHPARIPERPSVSMPGTVTKVIPPAQRSQPEKAKISLHAFDHKRQDLRIENSLTDANGEEVKLETGAHVEVTVSEDPKTPTS